MTFNYQHHRAAVHSVPGKLGDTINQNTGNNLIKFNCINNLLLVFFWLEFWKFSYFDRHQILWFCFEKVIDEPLISNQIDNIRKLLVEKIYQFFGCFDLIKISERHEQCNGPGFILIWKCNHHKFSTWPDVQVIHLHLKLK